MNLRVSSKNKNSVILSVENLHAPISEDFNQSTKQPISKPVTPMSKMNN